MEANRQRLDEGAESNPSRDAFDAASDHARSLLLWSEKFGRWPIEKDSLLMTLQDAPEKSGFGWSKSTAYKRYAEMLRLGAWREYAEWDGDRMVKRVEFLFPPWRNHSAAAESFRAGGMIPSPRNRSAAPEGRRDASQTLSAPEVQPAGAHSDRTARDVLMVWDGLGFGDKSARAVEEERAAENFDDDGEHAGELKALLIGAAEFKAAYPPRLEAALTRHLSGQTQGAAAAAELREALAEARGARRGDGTTPLGGALAGYLAVTAETATPQGRFRREAEVVKDLRARFAAIGAGGFNGVCLVRLARQVVEGGLEAERMMGCAIKAAADLAAAGTIEKSIVEALVGCLRNPECGFAISATDPSRWLSAP